MNIMLATGVFYPEPIAMSTIIKDIAIRLSQEGHCVKVITSPPCRPFGYKLPAQLNDPAWPFERIILPSYSCPESTLIGRYKESRSFGKALCDYIRGHHAQIDIIYACLFPLFCPKMVVKTANEYGIPVVMHVEDIYPEPFRYKIPIVGRFVYKMLLPLDRYALQHSTKVITIGPKLRDYLIRTRCLNAEQTDYVYNWQDESRFIGLTHTSDRQKSDLFTFMYVGSLSPAADLRYVVQCFIQARLNNVRLVLAGSGVLKEELQNMAQTAPDCHIEFWDAPFDQVPNIQAQADVLVLSLKAATGIRAFPSKFPAYLFSGKPVLASVNSDSDVAASIFNSNCGWVVEAGDDLEFVTAMKRIAETDSAELHRMGEAGMKYGIEYLTTEHNLRKIVTLILSSKQ